VTFVLSVLLLAAPGETPSSGADTVLVELAGGAQLELRTRPFVESEHQVERCEILGWTAVCLIDGRPVFGTDWELPHTVVESARVILGGRAVELDVSSMFDPMITSRKKELFRLTEVEGGYSLWGLFSDGAGAYEAEWLIIRDSSVRTALRYADH
jgi:hypothetical protein